jgi:energy-coupling factor transporter ATP-binding protein EcfA2
MRLREVILIWYRSVGYLNFEVKSFTVLYGRNNSGKTNVLEGIYGLLSPEHLDSERTDYTMPPRGMRGSSSPPMGAVLVELEEGAPFDDDVLVLRRSDSASPADSVPLPAFRAAFIGDHDETWLTFHDPHDYFRNHVYFEEKESYDGAAERAERAKLVATKVDDAPRPLPIFLDWEIDDIETRVGDALMEHLASKGLFVDVPVLLRDWPHEPGVPASWQINPKIQDFLDRFSGLANMFLPDFLDGSIHARIQVATAWKQRFSVTLSYYEPGSVDVESSGGSHDAVDSLGRGSSRWVAAAIQIALHLFVRSDSLDPVESLQEKHFSGTVLLIDEPETHLHPSAVKSVVRWCDGMVDVWGFNVVVATHHVEFLRHSGPDVAHVHITRGGNPLATNARTLLASTTPLLQDVARDLGVHPATVLSMVRGILFVEGPLDYAVLDEYAFAALDAAGVHIVPMHGTRNMSGLIDGELAPRLGIKVGVLTDDTDPETMGSRSKNKLSGEERKLNRLIKSYADQGFPPPTPFGVPERDLLFALPEKGIRKCYPDSASNFPGWLQMLEECRAAEGKSQQDSVQWKLYAEQHYGLPLNTAEGVRSVVRTLDLANVELPTIRRVIDQIVAWANG